jgi:predicted ATP-grasp superfamily ATP-dependent carboligase
VTDAEQRSALAVVRSLGRAGYRVHVCSARARALAGSSRFCLSHVRLPDPLRDPGAFAAGVRREAGRVHAAVILPITDAAMLALLPARQDLAPAVIPFPDLDVYERVADKALMLEHGKAAGFDVPRQLTLADPGPLADLNGLRFPLVVKPHRSVVGGSEGAVKLGVVHVADAPALRQALDALPPTAYPVLLQERIVGPGLGFFLLLWGGRRLAAFAHRRLIEKPPSGGVSVRSESVALDPVLIDRAERLLAGLQWRGVAMVECKQDLATGRLCLMEVNGRFWGSLQLAIDAGVDFPALLVRAALDQPVKPVQTYRVGVRMRSWWGEVDHLVTRLRRSNAALAVPPDAPGRVAVFGRWLLAPFAGVRGEVFRWDDPRPFLRESLEWFRGG